VIASTTVPTLITGNMVRNKDPVTNLVLADLSPDLDNLTSNFMTQNTWRPLYTIPLHNITATNTTGNDSNEYLIGIYLRIGEFFDSYVFVIVVYSSSQTYLTIAQLKY
jgi:hypothetical protein